MQKKNKKQKNSKIPKSSYNMLTQMTLSDLSH